MKDCNKDFSQPSCPLLSTLHVTLLHWVSPFVKQKRLITQAVLRGAVCSLAVFRVLRTAHAMEKMFQRWCLISKYNAEGGHKSMRYLSYNKGLKL